MVVARRSALAAAALACAAASCTTTDREFWVGADRVEVARNAQPDGAVETWVLEVRGAAEAVLQVVAERDRERPFLGLRVQDLDRRTAEVRGIEPYRGLLVTGTWPRSAAEAVGVRAGDVLLSIDGEATTDDVDLARREARLDVGRPVALALLRDGQTIAVEAAPRGVRERVVEPQTIELDKPEAAHPYAGIVLRGVPAVWAKQMCGDDRNVVFATAVDLGSPAWLAGIRAGDRIDEVDGRPCPTVLELGREIERRGAAGQSLPLRLSRDDTAFTAIVELDDYRAIHHVWVPFVCDVSDGARVDEWTVGPFGLLAGRRSTYVDDGTRTPAEHSEVDALFGLVRVESAAQQRRLVLLWVIPIPF